MLGQRLTTERAGYVGTHTLPKSRKRWRVCQVGMRMTTGYKESGAHSHRDHQDQGTTRQPRGRPRREPEGSGRGVRGKTWLRTKSKPSSGWGMPALEAAAGRAPATLTTAAGEVEHHDPGRRVATPAQNAKLEISPARG